MLPKGYILISHCIKLPDVFVSCPVEPFDVGSQVVLDIAGALVGHFESGELSEDVLQGFATHVGLKTTNTLILYSGTSYSDMSL